MNKPIKLFSVDFGIPVQAFYFDYKITSRGQMPILTEFVLRILRLGNSDVAEIQQFLGLSEHEVNALVRMLVKEDEIRIVDNKRLELTGKGLSHFSGAIDDIPGVTNLVELQNSIGFDLISFEYCKYSRENTVTGADIAGLHCVSSDLEKSSTSKDRVKRHFVSNFHQIFYELSDNGFDSIEHPNLYAVTDIEPRQAYYIRSTVDIKLEYEQKRLTDEWVNPPRTDWQEAIGKSQQSLNRPANGTSLAELFEALEYVKGVYACVEPSFNATKFLLDDGRPYNKGFSPFVGWFDSKLGLIEECISKHEFEKLEIEWIVPNVPIWGKSGDFVESVELLQNPKRLKRYTRNRFLNLHCPNIGRATKSYVKQLTNLLKSKNVSVDAQKGEYRNGDIEVLIFNDFLVVVVAYLYQNGSHWPIPFGFMSEDESIITAVAKDVLDNS